MQTGWRAGGVALAVLLVASPARAQGGPVPRGRFEGIARIPGAPAVLVLDLDRGPTGEWIGSVTAPGYGAKGLPLTALTQEDGGLRASAPLFGGATLRVRSSGGGLAGTLDAAGQSAPLELARTGEPQVDLPPRNAALATAFEGRWAAQFEVGAFKLHAELSLRNEAGGTSSGEMKVVEMGGTPLKLERIVQDGQGLRFKALDGQAIEYEGRLSPAGDAIDGRLYVAALDAPVRFERAPHPPGED